jgi:hypothetical protein
MFGERRTLLTRSEILRVKTRALRRGVWFRALTKTDRACIDLAVLVVERVRSRLLQRILSSLIRKLEEIMKSRVQRLMHEVGGSMAKKLSKIANEWGNESAVRWAEDSGFIRYLTITYLNEASR